MADWETNEPIRIFREYLQIPSVQPNVDYSKCVEFLNKQAASLDLPITVYHCSPGKPIVVITWTGSQPEQPSVMLNSHMDVVPVFEDSWTYPPFSAHIDSDGKIFARGSQDMKCVGIQFLEAVRRLKQGNVSLKRTIHMSFVPDEEIGGDLGMKLFVKTADFRALNVGVAIDEGMASPVQEYPLFYGERSIWHVEVHCTGPPGHGSLLLRNTAGEKLRYVIDKFMDFRKEQELLLKSNSDLTIGDVTTVNLTMLKGGIQSNVIPEILSAMFDVRVAIDVDHKEFEEKINGWCREAGEGVHIDFEQKGPYITPTKLDNTNPYWTAFKEATDELGLTLKPRIFPGGTDSRYVRQLGVPAFGFSPMNNTPVLLHDHNEFLKAETFLGGIDIYKTIIEKVANV